MKNRRMMVRRVVEMDGKMDDEEEDEEKEKNEGDEEEEDDIHVPVYLREPAVDLLGRGAECVPQRPLQIFQTLQQEPALRPPFTHHCSLIGHEQIKYLLQPVLQEEPKH